MSIIQRCTPEGVINDPLVWFGVRGYEDRSFESLNQLVEMGAKICRVRDAEYRTHLAPQRVAETRLADAARRLSNTLRRGRLASRRAAVPLPPYQMGPLRRALSDAQEEARYFGARLVIDITAMTGIHAVALASWIARAKHRAVTLALAYSSPEQYIVPDWRVSTGWSETVLAPVVAGTSSEERQRQFTLSVPDSANVVALLGHDGARTEWALRQIDVHRVWLFVAHEPEDGRSDVAAARSIGAHQKLFAAAEDTPDWRRCDFQKDEIAALRASVEAMAALSAEEHRRLVLLPYGPRIASVTAALAATNVIGSDAWFCYAVPERVYAESTVGYRRTDWFEPT